MVGPKLTGIAMPGFEEIAVKETKSLDFKENEAQAGGLLDLLAVHEKRSKEAPANAQLLRTVAGDNTPPPPMPLAQYLTVRADQDKEQSYFQVGVTHATRFGRYVLGMEDASSKFDKAIKQDDKETMRSLYYADVDQRKTENNVANYGGAMLKTGLLFGGGKYVGLVGFTAVTTTEQAKPADPFQRQAIDAVMGATKGVLTNLAFNAIKEQAWDPVAKGWTYGLTDRFLDAGLSSRTYQDQSGEWDIKGGAGRTLSSVFSPQSLIVDAATVGAPYAVLYPLNSYLGQALFKSPLGSKLIMAGVSGLTSGSLKDLNEQQNIHRTIDWVQVAKKGGEKGALDMISALPNPRGF